MKTLLYIVVECNAGPISYQLGPIYRDHLFYYINKQSIHEKLIMYGCW